MLQRYFAAVALLIMSTAGPREAVAAGRPVGSGSFDRNAARLALGFARHLEASGDYYRAITEFRRFLYLTNEGVCPAVVRFEIARSLQSARRHGAAAEAYGVLLDDPMLGERAAINSAISLLAQRKAALAYHVLQVAGEEGAGRARSPSSKYFLAMAAARLGKWDEVALVHQRLVEALGKKPTSKLDQNDRRILMNSKRNMVLLQAGYEQRSPGLAQVLSVLLPGAGHVYAGSWFDGLFYASLVALFGGMAWDSWSSGEGFLNQSFTFYGTSALAGLFYLGNIISAHNTAVRFNELQRRRFMDSLTMGPHPAPLPPPACPELDRWLGQPQGNQFQGTTRPDGAR